MNNNAEDSPVFGANAAYGNTTNGQANKPYKTNNTLDTGRKLTFSLKEFLATGQKYDADRHIIYGEVRF